MVTSSPRFVTAKPRARSEARPCESEVFKVAVGQFGPEHFRFPLVIPTELQAHLSSGAVRGNRSQKDTLSLTPVVLGAWDLLTLCVVDDICL